MNTPAPTTGDKRPIENPKGRQPKFRRLSPRAFARLKFDQAIADLDYERARRAFEKAHAKGGSAWTSDLEDDLESLRRETQTEHRALLVPTEDERPLKRKDAVLRESFFLAVQARDYPMARAIYLKALGTSGRGGWGWTRDMEQPLDDMRIAATEGLAKLIAGQYADYMPREGMSSSQFRARVADLAEALGERTYDELDDLGNLQMGSPKLNAVFLDICNTVVDAYLQSMERPRKNPVFSWPMLAAVGAVVSGVVAVLTRPRATVAA